jgi:hypothetical protein
MDSSTPVLTTTTYMHLIPPREILYGLLSLVSADHILSSSAVATGVVYVGSWDHKPYAFDAGTGAMLWNASTVGDIQLSSPAVVNSFVYIGSYDHMLYAFTSQVGHSERSKNVDEKRNVCLLEKSSRSLITSCLGSGIINSSNRRRLTERSAT